MGDVYKLPNSKTLDGLNLLIPSLKFLFEAKIDDIRLKRGETVLISSYPRSGSTWLSHIISLLLAPEAKYEEMKIQHIMKRVLYAEWTQNDHPLAEVQKIEDVPAPRAIKTHLPYRFIPRWVSEDKVKTIVINRNPKDMLVSLYHFYLQRKVFEFSGTWDEFFAHVQSGNILYGDPYDWLKDWDVNKDKGDILFVKYEDLKKDTIAQVRRIASFLDLTISEARLEQVVRDSSLGHMKEAAVFQYPGFKSGGKQVRTGQTGEWEQFFTPEQNEWFDAKYKEAYEALDIVDYPKSKL